MNLDNIQYCDLPFKHWEFKNCTDDLTLKEISNCSVPDGERAYDGTRAADHTGQGKDGKLRLFIILIMQLFKLYKSLFHFPFFELHRYNFTNSFFNLSDTVYEICFFHGKFVVGYHYKLCFIREFL